MDLFSNYINVVFYVLAFLIGGIPFGMLFTKLIYKIDLMQVGSGSIGATNVYRALKDIDPKRAKFFSIATLILDATKGLIVVLLAKLCGLPYGAQWMIALLAIIGHCYSPYLGFRGGKGVSTAIGSVILLIPIEGALGLVVWAVVGKVFKVSSLSSLLGVLSGIALTFIVPYILPLPACISVEEQIHSHVPLVLIGLFIIYTHIPNIKRLFSGQESKVL
ncbi:acyl-phosphate--glycerol-3-phosphate O-acyltransferase [Helicobacter sp. CLO-3]|uniref:glycerol-3-phosphate 1-O-acyltransferase PlsY n=1 Tax=unclassified Helicobacter TaxID=2593540 RepID=UPI000805A63F|nr:MULTISPECIES: glycerol-3-phosphate 1-O-acyltransferase PlsY [unclassified Helicobacter]OBV28608.1 glycerol-3-phosphate acyltransferase [Helicobacter sp. CLO-3]OHU82511.1 acyl-phosphate--glycerol-3-phosphate O-acyltransferase [Helicobacter sp. CLO-3]